MVSPLILLPHPDSRKVENMRHILGYGLMQHQLHLYAMEAEGLSAQLLIRFLHQTGEYL